jgi:peptidoglycan/LPS O-acetylase OafA/YrhL
MQEGNSDALTKTRGFNSDVEILRAFAVSITFVAHIYMLDKAWRPWTDYFWLGGGVDLFFAISGFLIIKQLLGFRDRSSSFREYARTFWIRRLYRLWPAALLWSSAAVLFAVATHQPEIRELLRALAFGMLNVENWYIMSCAASPHPCGETMLSPYWSLSLEEQFYLVAPFAIYFLRDARSLLTISLVLASAQFFSHRPWPGLLWFNRSDAILYGCALAIAWHQYPDALRRRLHAIPVTVLRSMLTISLCCLVPLARPQISAYFMGFVAVAAGMTVVICSANLELFPRTGLTAPLSFIGSRSYSIYLIHVTVFYVIHDLGMKSSLGSLAI